MRIQVKYLDGSEPEYIDGVTEKVVVGGELTAWGGDKVIAVRQGVATALQVRE